jgi:hypothetical protein
MAVLLLLRPYPTNITKSGIVLIFWTFQRSHCLPASISWVQDATTMWLEHAESFGMPTRCRSRLGEKLVTATFLGTWWSVGTWSTCIGHNGCLITHVRMGLTKESVMHARRHPVRGSCMFWSGHRINAVFRLPDGVISDAAQELLMVDLSRLCSGSVTMDASGIATPFTGQNARTIQISWRGPKSMSDQRPMRMASFTGPTYTFRYW